MCLSKLFIVWFKHCDFFAGLAPATGFPNAPYVINATQEPYTLIAGKPISCTPSPTEIHLNCFVDENFQR